MKAIRTLAASVLAASGDRAGRGASVLAAVLGVSAVVLHC